MESLQKNKIWNLVEIPKGWKVIGQHQVYKLKKNSKDNIERFKAKPGVKSYAQKTCIDFDEIFSPIVHFTTIKIVLTIIPVMDLELE